MITIDELFRTALRDVIRDAIRDELAPVMEAINKKPISPPPAAPTEQRFLTPHQAAQMAGICEETVREWVRKGRLTRFHAGRKLRIERAEFERFMADDRGGKDVIDIRSRAKDILSSI